jgi:hypothetical protein
MVGLILDINNPKRQCSDLGALPFCIFAEGSRKELFTSNQFSMQRIALCLLLLLIYCRCMTVTFGPIITKGAPVKGESWSFVPSNPPDVLAILEELYAKSAKEGSSPDTIFLDNPSFESMPGPSLVPSDWFVYGSPGESPPDTQPGFFGVKTRPQEGETYLGMVTRDNGTTEGVIQYLDYPMLPGNQYEMSLFLSTSEVLVSNSRKTNETVQYTTPVDLSILGYKAGSNALCMIAKVQKIEHFNWQLYTIPIRPCDTIECIVFSASQPYEAAVNGNILIDNCSPIVRVQSLKSKAPTDK